jgi:CheY-like chemotaxis protein
MKDICIISLIHFYGEYLVSQFGCTILIVEDDLSILKLLEFIFKKEYKVILAENGQIAFDKIQLGEKPDLIISDIMMPELTGLELKEKLNQDAELSKIPFIFLTAINDSGTKEKMTSLGALEYIVKPIRPNDLKEKIKSFIERN